jgi:hypothetical protein
MKTLGATGSLADRVVPEHAKAHGVRVRLDAIELRQPRQWGACWLACQLYEQLEFDWFWSRRLPDSRERTCWRHISQTLVCYRLIDPGREWRLHRLWFERSVMADLLGADDALVEKNALYRCLDKLLEHKAALFSHRMLPPLLTLTSVAAISRSRASTRPESSALRAEHSFTSGVSSSNSLVGDVRICAPLWAVSVFDSDRRKPRSASTSARIERRI